MTHIPDRRFCFSEGEVVASGPVTHSLPSFETCTPHSQVVETIVARADNPSAHTLDIHSLVDELQQINVTSKLPAPPTSIIVATSSIIPDASTAISSASLSTKCSLLESSAENDDSVLNMEHIETVSINHSSPPEALKKCACCHRILPDSDYSGTQLKVKGKRQCKICVAGRQADVQQSQCSEFYVKQYKALLFLSQAMSGPLNSKRVIGVLRTLQDSMRNYRSTPSNCSEYVDVDTCVRGVTDPMQNPHTTIYMGESCGVNTQIAVGILQLVQKTQTNVFLALALECMTVMCNDRAILAQFVAAGAIPILVKVLESRGHDSVMWANDPIVIWDVRTFQIIAAGSCSNCDVLLTAGALDALLPFIRVDMSVDVCGPLFHVLSFIVRGRQPVGEMALAVTRVCIVLMDVTVPQEIRSLCLTTLGEIIFVPDDQVPEPWVEFILTCTPEFPQRLVDLVDDNQLDGTLLWLINNLLKGRTEQLRLLFDCGLTGKLLPLLGHMGSTKKELDILPICVNAAGNIKCASLLVNSAPIIQRVLSLMATSEGETLQHAVILVYNMLFHCDRQLTGRLIHECRVLPSIVAALRRAIRMAHHEMTLALLHSVSNVLLVGDDEAVDDPREINPYIELLDWLGVFELAKPLQDNADARMSEVASHVFSYFIPNDCE